MNTWSHQSQLRLVALPNAPYWARRYAEAILAKWDIEGLCTNAQLVITELVTNAVRVTSTLDEQTQMAYARNPQAMPYTELIKLGTVRLRLAYGNNWLLIEVWDQSNEPPAEQVPDTVSQHGRGLFLVSAFCEKWGWYPTYVVERNGERRQSGKVVWAELRP